LRPKIVSDPIKKQSGSHKITVKLNECLKHKKTFSQLIYFLENIPAIYKLSV